MDMHMTEQSAYRRLDYLDVAKAIGIFLAVLGHTLGTKDSTVFRTVIYSFHMPLFFIISGMVTRSRGTAGYGARQWGAFLRKNILKLMLPYFIFALMFSSFSTESVLYILYGSHETLLSAGAVGWPSFMWYIPCLFVARILMELVLMGCARLKHIDSHVCAGIIAVPAVILGLVFDTVGIEIGILWCANLSLMGLGFMLAGYALKSLPAYVCKMKMLWQLACTAAMTAVFAASLYLTEVGEGADRAFYLMLMCNGDYGKPVPFLLTSFSGSAVVILLGCLFVSLPKNRIVSDAEKCLLWTGQNTFGILLLHKPFLVEVIVPFAVLLGLPVPTLWTNSLCSLVSVGFCFAMIKLIELTLPELIGKDRVCRNQAGDHRQGQELS